MGGMGSMGSMWVWRGYSKVGVDNRWIPFGRCKAQMLEGVGIRFMNDASGRALLVCGGNTIG